MVNKLVSFVSCDDVKEKSMKSLEATHTRIQNYSSRTFNLGLVFLLGSIYLYGNSNYPASYTALGASMISITLSGLLDLGAVEVEGALDR